MLFGSCFLLACLACFVILHLARVEGGIEVKDGFMRGDTLQWCTLVVEHRNEVP